MSTASPKKRGIITGFFLFLWRALKAFNIILFGFIGALIIGSLLFAALSQGGAKIPGGGALVLNPSGTLVEQKNAVGAAATLLQGDDLPQQTLVKDLVDALMLAKNDDRIELVVLELGKLGHGLLPKLERVSAAIVDFKSSGKKIIAVADNYSQSGLYLAAHADEVLLNPEGIAVVEGFAMYSPFFKSFLDKHDVTINLFKVGKYKSVADPFFRDNMSSEDKQARLGILEPWWESYTSSIEMIRGMPAGSINEMLSNANEKIQSANGNLAQLSMDMGLVDKLVTDSERRDYLIALAGEDSENKSYRNIEYKDYLRAARLPEPDKAGKVAVITAVGNIVNGHAPAGEIGGQSLTELIRNARLNDDVEAIVLRIDSGGGSKSASEKIRSELLEAQKSGIPVVASMGSVAASGGYWIAASADEIWATPNTITGSIGIFGLMPSFEKTLANYGVYTDGVATTPLAGGASAIRGITPEYRDVLQTIIEAGYQQFLTLVANERSMDVDAVHEIAQGRIWTGEKAHQLGLVDQLGDLDQAIAAAASLAKLEDYSVWHVEPELSFEDRILRKFAEALVPDLPKLMNHPMSRLASSIKKDLAMLERLNDPGHTYVICGNCPSSM